MAWVAAVVVVWVAARGAQAVDVLDPAARAGAFLAAAHLALRRRLRA